MAGLPPWLSVSPISGVPLFLQGFGQGQHAAAANLERDMESARVDEHAQAVAQETELQKERLAGTLASDMMERQMKAQTAARQLRGMQNYQSLVGGGMDPSQALIHAAPEMFYQHPEHFTTALDQAARRKQAEQTTAATETFRGTQTAETERHHRALEDVASGKLSAPKLFHVGNSLLRVNPDGTEETLFTSNDPSKLDQWEHSELMAQLNASKQLGMDSPEYKQSKQALDTFRKRFTAPKTEAAAAATDDVLPMPKTKIELQIGHRYQTVRGPAMWDGTHFVR